MLKFLFAVIFLCIATLMVWIAMTNENFCLSCGFQTDSSSLNSNGLQNFLIEDLKAAAKAKELPAIWNDILEVRYLYHSKKTQRILNNSPIVSLNKKGSKRLLVEFFDEPDNAQILLIRYSLVDSKTGNTVGEINRRLKWTQ